MISEAVYSEVLEIRYKAMYPDKSIEYVKLPEDGKGLHIGYYKEGTLVSVMTLFLHGRELQFRKLATLQEYQGQGFGTELVKWALDYANDMQFERVWCNSRADKVDFYKRFNFQETKETFVKDDIQFVILEIKPTIEASRP